jgi:ABC-2 type transport system ATP-binding protein
VTVALAAEALGKRYGSQWALHDCTFALGQGHVTALVGPNGAGKSTLLELAAGLIEPTAGRVTVFGRNPIKEAAAVLPMLGFVGQDRPLYRGFTVGDMLTFGRKLNSSWDHNFAMTRVGVLDSTSARELVTFQAGSRHKWRW